MTSGATRADAAGTAALSACPGCGVVLPTEDWPVGRGAQASSACWHLRATVQAHELSHVARLGGIHQLSVDAYAAQHVVQGTPSIATIFSLVGLHLGLELGWSGTAVRAAHQHLGQRFRTWPTFQPPPSRDWLTIADVAGSATPEDHAQRVAAWAASVWKGWSSEHDRVRDWTDEALPAEERGRLSSA